VHQKSGLKGGVAFDWRDLVKGGLLYFFFVMKLLFFYQQEIYGYVGKKGNFYITEGCALAL
jgi:hypothetical protein